jgi:hypothetical protein
MSDFKADEADTDIHKCLCCNQRVAEKGKPITPERAAHSFAVLTAMGFTRKALLTRHRAQLEFQSPGMVEWLEGQAEERRP